MTTTVYFDLDGTLIDYTTPFTELFAQTVPTDASEEMANTYFEQVLSGITQVEEDPYRRAFEIVRQEYDLDVNPEAIAATYIEKEATATHIRPSVRQLVERVATRCQTGILTNGDGRMQRRKLEKHGLADLVDTVIVSNEVGSRKPEQDIFEEAKKRLPAETFIYVGDTFEEDIVPALEVGFRTVYVGEEYQPDAPIAARGTEELARLLLPLIREDTVK
ncbi:HAD family hydrolase [Natrinema sp. 1APR25-10V2]|uniref:HAD family hydrolase n=1 Tax=Natrinema sp. 1APR25-10V2 TaxID=2951081 RepID=UPI002874C8C7|nr:HAD family hydrolase [Natrinema sp. 1APR25-10V2]MDS0474683.1 HAD family hydrolase [Natrinema sp. 1APR25-10V2]